MKQETIEALNNLPLKQLGIEDCMFALINQEGLNSFEDQVLNLYKEFNKQKFKEQEEIRDNYYKLLNDT